MVSPGPRASPATREEEEKTGLLVCLQVLEVLEPKVCPDPLVWTDLMALVDLKASLEPQVGVREVAQVPPVLQVLRGREACPIQEVQATPGRREREEIQVVLDE